MREVPVHTHGIAQLGKRATDTPKAATKRTLGMAVMIVLALFASACGSDGDDSSTDEAGSDSADGTQNTCPADGCTIDFGSMEADGSEIKVTWDINFSPDIAGNHVHIYWDTYSAAQVSNDAADRDVTQGEWVPTDEAPNYVTAGAVSTAVRGDSTTLCLVAADRDHNVIDEGAQVCKDVSDLL